MNIYNKRTDYRKIYEDNYGKWHGDKCKYIK